MKGRLIGLDMNGWHDFAVRNWVKNRDGTDQSVSDGYIVDGGTLSRIVEVGDDVLTTVGGPRAQLALHGRGPGWGDFGDEKRRALLRRSDDPKTMGTAMRELGSEARIAVLAVPDEPSMDEVKRERRLDAMRPLRARRTMLVWSSVALALTQCTDLSVEADQKLGIVELDAQGVRIQTLDIVERNGLLTPRRRSTGRVLRASVGLATREEQALDQIVANAKDPRVARALALANLPALLSMAGPGVVLDELIRLENGDWFEAIGEAPDVDWEVQLGDLLTGCGRIVLHGPCQDDLLKVIASRLEREIDVSITVVPPHAVARGAFLAANRIHLGLPPWFDYLPNIETIVQVRDDVESLPLVKPNDVAEAGKVWRSSKPVPLVWQAKSNRIEVWLKKEGDPNPRFSPAVVQVAPGKNEDVELFLEQEPAQGRAKLRIESRGWPELRDRPAVVDWDAGEHDELGRDWEAIIADFKVRPPVVPERVILPAHRELWYPEQGGGLAQALERFDGRDYEPVYRALSARRQVYFDQPNHPDHMLQFYAIDSDGGRPDGVQNEDWDRLISIIERAEADFTQGRVQDNDALGVLSWCFNLCPVTVWPIVANVLRSRGGGPSFRGWHIMYPQALGRIASSEPAFLGAIDYLNGLDLPWNMNQQACAAFLLSRNDEVFDLLDRSTIDRWAHGAILSLQDARRQGFGKRYRYLPILIAGLLRWRTQEPMAFTESQDPAAIPLIHSLGEVLNDQDLNQRDQISYESVLSAIKDTGARPDLLQTLFNLV